MDRAGLSVSVSRLLRFHTDPAGAGICVWLRDCRGISTRNIGLGFRGQRHTPPSFRDPYHRPYRGPWSQPW